MSELGSGRAESSGREARHEQLNQPPRGRRRGGEAKKNIIYEMEQPSRELQPAASASPARQGGGEASLERVRAALNLGAAACRAAPLAPHL